jgi:Anticodon binding domain
VNLEPAVNPTNREVNAAATPDAEAAPAANLFAARDVEEILRERGWLDADATAKLSERENAGISEWLERAAALLGPRAADREQLEALLSLIFSYDARAILETSDAQAVIARMGAREVIRELARRVLGGPAIDSDGFKALIEELKSATRYRSRELFHPIRVALAGRLGEGELDRVILLLDSAAELPFATPVKGTRTRMLEFCAALD